jgi:hypothetical protein
LYDPSFVSVVARLRQQEMLADAERRRAVRRQAKLARASRREQRAERRMCRAKSKTLRLRSELEF